MNGRVWLLGLVVLIAIASTACGTVRIEAGRLVDPSVLETQLRIGESTREDVRAALGAPLGEGRAMLPMDPGPRTVWSYAFAEVLVEGVEAKDAREMSVWIYFDGNRYDGYLWFSSLPKR